MRDFILGCVTVTVITLSLVYLQAMGQKAITLPDVTAKAGPCVPVEITIHGKEVAGELCLDTVLDEEDLSSEDWTAGVERGARI